MMNRPMCSQEKHHGRQRVEMWLKMPQDEASVNKKADEQKLLRQREGSAQHSVSHESLSLHGEQGQSHSRLRVCEPARRDGTHL